MISERRARMGRRQAVRLSAGGGRPFRLAVLLVTSVVAVGGCSGAGWGGLNAEALKRRPGFDWKEAEASGNARIYYLPGSPSERRLDWLRADVERSERRVVALVGAPSDDTTLHVFTVASRRQMKDLIGRETNGAAMPGASALAVVVADTWAATGPHEMLHVFAYRQWGIGQHWINEGLAVYADDRWHGYDLHRLARYLQNENRLIPLDALQASFGKHPDLITYPEAGSFVKYLYETYGREAVKQAYTGGGRALSLATGKKLEVLEREWHRVLEDADPTGVRYSYGLSSGEKQSPVSRGGD